ncbi:MAG: YaeQ family protein [Planctomycetes bacterium]|nr:YaeQ family protein [Planctomycetota bacterium]
MARLGFDLSVNDYNRDLFAERKLVLELRENEGLHHIALKVLAMILYFDAKLQIEPNFEDDKYKPDLLLRADDYRPALWIECGQCRVEKLDKVSFRYNEARIVMIRRTDREARDIFERSHGEVRRLHGIEFIGFDNGFCDALAETLRGRNDIIGIVSGDELQVVAGGVTHSTHIHRYHKEPEVRIR